MTVTTPHLEADRTSDPAATRRVVVLGLGRIGLQYAAAAASRDDVALAGLVDPRGPLRRFARGAGFAMPSSGSLEKLLAKVPAVRVVLRSSSMPAIVEAAVRGHGICAITRAWGEATEGLEHIVALPSIPPRPVWLVAHPDVLERPAVRLVADAIANGFRDLRAARRG